MYPNKTRIKRGYMNGKDRAGLVCIQLIFTPFILVSCGEIPFELISEVEADEIKAVRKSCLMYEFV